MVGIYREKRHINSDVGRLVMGVLRVGRSKLWDVSKAGRLVMGRFESGTF
jgi:hypothetical protein